MRFSCVSERDLNLPDECVCKGVGVCSFVSEGFFRWTEVPVMVVCVGCVWVWAWECVWACEGPRGGGHRGCGQ